MTTFFRDMFEYEILRINMNEKNNRRESVLGFWTVPLNLSVFFQRSRPTCMLNINNNNTEMRI